MAEDKKEGTHLSHISCGELEYSRLIKKSGLENVQERLGKIPQEDNRLTMEDVGGDY